MVCLVSGCQFLLADSGKPKLPASDRTGDLGRKVGARVSDSGNADGFTVGVSLSPPNARQ